MISPSPASSPKSIGQLHSETSSKNCREWLPSQSYLAKLEMARKFSGRYTTAAFDQTDDFLAYDKALSMGPKIRDDLNFLLYNASPAGRLYAALLLEHIDSDAGRRALMRLSEDRSIVESSFVGCLGAKGPVSRVALALLRRPEIRVENFEKKDLRLEFSKSDRHAARKHSR